MISINRRLIEGVVIESRDLKEEKMSVRKSDYELKNVNKVLINGNFLGDKHIELIKWMSDYYRIPLGLSLKTILPKHPKKFELSNALIKKENTPPLPGLPDNLQDIFKKIDASERDILLHNFESINLSILYANLIESAIKNNKQVLILEPKIDLAKKVFIEMQKYFDKNAVLLDKNSTPKKYWDAWQKIKNNDAKIIIGTRSAIFAPIENLGLIILKNEHSTSYKNWDQAPRYHAKDIALRIARSNNARIIYESATPSLEAYYKTKTGEAELIEIREPEKQTKSLREIVDMREELRGGNYSIISERLKKEISRSLDKKEKTILFMNRRGVATAVICRDCGFVIKCPSCDAPMTYHSFPGKRDLLICHYCDLNAPIPALCPKCKSHRIKYIGTGTQRVVEEINALFPKAKIRRIDSDALKQEETFFTNDISNDNSDILIGTQMIISGEIENKFSLAGVINADTMLHLPDFRAGEKTFQLLGQLGNMAGKMIIQTYNTDNFVIKSVANSDYSGFFKKELEDRKIFSYPPFSKLIMLSYSHKDPLTAKKEAKFLALKLSEILKKISKNPIEKVEIIGPAPAYVYKIKNLYVWHIILKIKDDRVKDILLKIVPSEWLIDIDPISIL